MWPFKEPLSNRNKELDNRALTSRVPFFTSGKERLESMINDRDWADGRIDGSRVIPPEATINPIIKSNPLSAEQNLEDFLLSIKVGIRNLMQQARAEGIRDTVGEHFMMPEEKASHMVNKIHNDARKEVLELSIARIIGLVEATMEETAMRVLSTRDQLIFIRKLRDKLTDNHDIYEVHLPG